MINLTGMLGQVNVLLKILLVLGAAKGGVAIFWKKTLSGISIVETLDHDRICAIRMENQNGSVFIFISVYMPASGSSESMSIIIDELSAFIDDLDDGCIPIIAGDFNGTLGAQGGPRGCGQPNKHGKTILSFMKEHNLESVNMSSMAKGPVNTFIGHNGSSAIDHIMVPKFFTESVNECIFGRNNGLNTSDHLPIEVVVTIPLLPRKIMIEKKSTRIRWEKLKDNELAQRVCHTISNGVLEIEERLVNNAPITATEIDQGFNDIVSLLHEAAALIPKCKFKSNLKPYWCEELNALKKDKMFWFNEWKAQGRTLDDDNFVRSQMKSTKKLFCKRIRQISREYQNQLISDATSKAEINRNDFWRLMKRMKGKNQASYNAIKNRNGTVVYELDEVLGVWSEHFDKLSSPRWDPSFNHINFERVKTFVEASTNLKDKSEFLDNPFTEKEIGEAINKLNSGKTPGHDGITTEHIVYAGPPLCRVIRTLFNMCVDIEYIPCNFRRGIQVPLYKGKNSCPLQPDNYRGITLLSTFNKLFESVIWGRISKWWVESHATSVLQGAARKGFSCIHTALTLQETIAKEREGGKKVFVAYFDVSKAFDSVWTNGLFFQLYNMGITGNLWRLLYKSYVNFTCCVRIGGRDSVWYPMDCGIHQGGYLSLVKYTAYIDSLIQILEQSDLCSSIYRVKTSPVGYADDLAASTISKRKMDNVMQIVYEHGCDWRYAFNAAKSAVLVYGETPREMRIGAEYRMFSLGGNRVCERMYYDHVGVKSCVKGDGHVRTEEKISKARKVLNMNTNIGIRRGGLNLKTCNLIFWTIVVPTLLFGCEVWVLKKRDVELLNAFQRYAARRLQRFKFNSFNATCFACLGWMNIVQFIKAKKIIFLRTILVMEHGMPIRRVLVEKINSYNAEDRNEFDSPLSQILSYCAEFDLLERVIIMASEVNINMSKSMWKRIVWEKVWAGEIEHWTEYTSNNSKCDLINLVTPSPMYSIWWMISDIHQDFMRRCETMVRILCHTSLLKCDDVKLIGSTFSDRSCILCNNEGYEDIRHIIMQCPAQTELRRGMYNEIDRNIPGSSNLCSFDVLLGNRIEGWDCNDMVPIWLITCTYIVRMYHKVLRFRNIPR